MRVACFGVINNYCMTIDNSNPPQHVFSQNRYTFSWSIVNKKLFVDANGRTGLRSHGPRPKLAAGSGNIGSFAVTNNRRVIAFHKHVLKIRYR